MSLSITKRHWMPNEQALSVLEENVEKLCTAAELGKKYDVSLYVSISTPYNSSMVLDEAMAVRTAEAIEKLRKEGIDVWYDTNGATAGYKFTKALFPETLSIMKSSEMVFALCCLDQFPLHEQVQVEAAVDLAQKLVHDTKLYANGSRNVPVTLGIDSMASNMRIVEELIYNFVTQSDAFKTIKPTWAQASPAYEHFGESTSGFYFINPAHPLFERVRKEVRERTDITSKPGFVIEYFTAMCAGVANAVSAGYVYAVRNPFDVQIDPMSERAKVIQTVEHNARKLGTTSVERKLRDILTDENRLSFLQEFYEVSTIDYVLSAMRKGMEKQDY